MKKLIREFFFLRRGERRALIVVMILLCCSLVLRIWVAYLPVPNTEIDPEFFEVMTDIQKELRLAAEKKYEPKYRPKFKEEEIKELLPFPFDPNSISLDSLLLMNISDYVAGNIVRYREAGGEYRKPEDLQKIYGMEQSVYEALSSFIQIAEPEKNFLDWNSAKKDSIPLIELNTADSIVLLSIPGIGPSYSRRVLKYRDMLGGYNMYDQLWEVYGMDTVRFNALQDYTVMDSSKIEKILLNTTTFKELISHPYIEKSDTYAILQYRDFVDSIKSVYELESNQIIDHDRFIRMLPYLTIK